MRIFKTLLSTCLLVMALSTSAHAAEGNPMVLMKTNMGDIKIELFEKEAPKTVANFLAYVKDGHYSGSIFHRVIPGFVIQGGGFDTDYGRQPTAHPPVYNESDNGLKNERGTLSMARTSDPHSATSQFFVNLSDNVPLDHRNGNWGYAVYGKVTEGMDVVDKIAAIPTGPAGPFRSEAPREQAVIESATVIEE